MKTTIKQAYKQSKKNKPLGWVTFKDLEEPKESQVWIIDSYNPAYKEYSLINWLDSSKEKFCKGDKVCYNDFIF